MDLYTKWIKESKANSARFDAVERKSQYAEVAGIRQRSSGRWELQPPSANSPVLFDSKEEAIDYAVAQGWGVHLK